MEKTFRYVIRQEEKDSHGKINLFDVKIEYRQIMALDSLEKLQENNPNKTYNLYYVTEERIE